MVVEKYKLQTIYNIKWTYNTFNHKNMLCVVNYFLTKNAYDILVTQLQIQFSTLVINFAKYYIIYFLNMANTPR